MISILEQRVNKLNTFVLQALDSQILYVQIKIYFSGFEPFRFGPRRGRIEVRSFLKWRHPQLFRALNTERTAGTEGLADELIFHICCKRPLVNVTKENVYGRVKKLTLDSVTK